MRNIRHNKQNETRNEMKRNEMSQKSEIEIKKQLNFSAFGIDIQNIYNRNWGRNVRNRKCVLHVGKFLKTN